MSEERLKEIQDNIESQYDFAKIVGEKNFLLDEEKELYNEVIRLKKENDKFWAIIKDNEKEITHHLLENTELEQRINKAIEYIELRKQICEKQDNITGINILVELENILRGDK